MRKISLIAAVGAIVLASCAGNPEGKKADTTDATEVTEVSGTTYAVDATQSKVVWKGTKVTGFHEGTVDIKTGNIIVDNDAIVGGGFVLDLNTINTTDLEGEYKANLDGHLKDADFFDVANHPEASFEITEVKAGEAADELVVSGNLTIKGITKNITFNTKVEEITETTVKTFADFNIAREDWGVNYSGKQDDLISKEINFKITIVANNA